MKAYGEGIYIYIHISLTSTLLGGEWSSSRLGRFTPRSHWIGRYVSREAGLDDVEKRRILTLPEPELRPLCRAVSKQSLY
jgi:hypothetical protein